MRSFRTGVPLLVAMLLVPALTCADKLPAALAGQPVGSAGFNDMLGKQIKPGTMMVEQQQDGSFLLTNKLQTVSARVTERGVTFDSIGNSAGKGGFTLKLDKWGRTPSLKSAASSSLYKKDDAVYHAYTNGLAEKFSNSSGGIQQDFIIANKPKGKGDLHLQLQVSDAKVEQKSTGATIILKSGRKLTYDRLVVKDSSGKTIPSEIHVAGKNFIDVVVSDIDAKYPLMIDPTIGDEYWRSIGGISGANAPVRAIATYGNNVYVGGDFSEIGSVTAHYIAKWDGSQWSTLGVGVNGTVRALAVDSTGNLYAGGDFTMAGNTQSLEHVAMWDGSSWTGLGGAGGSDGSVMTLAIDNTDHLYAGGNFTTMDGGATQFHGLARWNATNWVVVGSGPAIGSVYALAFDVAGNLYAGGGKATGGKGFVQKWDGSNWTTLGTGMNNTVYALVMDGSGHVYAGGSFTSVDGLAVNYLSKWSGTNWQAVGWGVAGSVYALTIDSNGYLYAGGNFSTVSQWAGSGWATPGAGLGYTPFGPGAILTQRMDLLSVSIQKALAWHLSAA